ncbi:hypothetical protein K2F43_20815 [Clostridium estertheticum]|uniref:hypothetical protein n=1 Tax=Clostridium estertheticum TaxID=238834 RepID=UPI001C6E12C6|nr:hypothetical protein [Clostridium estertheticum]MBW9173631.1 hypothetical protein [Clostridium estertheticum]WLC74207.1 hypothetical protein KTC99_15730 [Clostridium estertheticum]
MHVVWSKKINIDDTQSVDFKGEKFSVCSSECKRRYEETKVKQDNNRKKFLLLLITNFLIFLGICIINGVYALLYLSESIGIKILIYPYTTPETVKLLGLKKSRKIAKTIAIAIMTLGIAFYAAIVLI